MELQKLQLSEQKLDYIARSYFADERDQEKVKDAIGDAFQDARPTPCSISEQSARFAIDGAIQYGRENRNPPPSKDHWLYEYWSIGQQLRRLGETGWDNVTPLATQEPQA